MSIPCEGNQFNRIDVITGQGECPKGATFVAKDGLKISRLDKRQHKVSHIGWGQGTYPDNNTVGEGGVIVVQ